MIEASGSVPRVETSIAICARGGVVILLGLPPHGDLAQFSPHDLVNHDVIIQGSFAYTSDAFADVVRRVNARDLEPSFLITRRFDLESSPAAVAALHGGRSREPRGNRHPDVGSLKSQLSRCQLLRSPAAVALGSMPSVLRDRSRNAVLIVRFTKAKDSLPNRD